MFVFPDPVRKAFEALPLPLVIEQFIDEKVVPLLVSDGFCRLVGKDRKSTMEWFFGSQYERVHPDDVGNVAHVSDEFAHHRGDYNVIFRAKHEEGYHYIHAVGEWMTAHDGTELAVLIYRDVSDSGRTITKLADQYDLFKQDVFYSDPVTGLPNRNYFNRFGEDKLHAIRTAEQTPALIFCDINAMKSYNSQYGYEKGDDLIRLVASLLRESFPEELLVRGSEDQLVLLVTLDNRDQLIAQLEEVNRRVRQEAFGNTTGIQAGIRVLQPSTTLLEAADQARHALRMIRSDLNTVCCFYSQVVEERYWQQLYVIQNIDKAVENGWIKVYYQGIAETVTGNSVALEALARWVDPVRGIISPADFIPVLMKYHQLHKLDLYMFEQVCREVSIRKDAGLPLLPVSVNFARQDFDHINMVEELNRIVDSYQIGQYGIGKDYFIIEITEQDIATAPERFYDQLKTLRADGFKVWLDDFGSAYSSLNVFSKFETDLIKMDMELLRNLDDHKGANREILKSIIGICRKLGIHTLAEGVETEEQREFLIEIGCELAQGYLYHRPDALDSILYKRQNGRRNHQVVTRKRLKELI